MKKTVSENFKNAVVLFCECIYQTITQSIIWIAIGLIKLVECLESHSNLKRAISDLKSWM